MASLQDRITRRQMMQLAAAGVAVDTQGGWFRQLANAAAPDTKRKRSCILLWMPGGPSHIDTFDPKPGTETGGPFAALTSRTEVRAAPQFHIILTIDKSLMYFSSAAHPRESR